MVPAPSSPADRVPLAGGVRPGAFSLYFGSRSEPSAHRPRGVAIESRVSFQDRTKPLEATAGRSRLVRAVIPADGASPHALLRRGLGGSRGFWARQGGWVAHIGRLASVIVTPDDRVDDRFAEAGARALELLGTDDPGPSRLTADAAPPPRLYGGAAFLNDHRAAGFWSGFPAVDFLVPTLELESVGGERWLRAQELVSEGEEADVVRGRLESRLEEVLEGLRTTVDAEPLENGGLSGPMTARPGAEERGAWEAAVGEALAEIRRGTFSKVVLARTLDVTPSALPDPLVVLAHLRRQNPGAHVFLFEPRPGATLLGAAPEILATLLGGDFHATAVAGSVPRGSSDRERDALARKLLASRKDRAEHQYTVDDMVARLDPLVEDVRADPEPGVLALAGIQHLETHIRATAPRDRDVLSLLSALHPTPAVCGFPRDPALEFLRREEPFERGWYAGPVGWFDTRGNGVFVPALRSAVVREGTWRLFAGAGIVAGSEPSLEWEETWIKFEPVLRALAASRSGEEGGPPA